MGVSIAASNAAVGQTTRSTTPIADLAAEIERLRAAGEPTTAAEFKSWPTLADANNAYVVARAIDAALVTDGPAFEALRSAATPHLPLDAAERRRIEDHLAESAAAVALLPGLAGKAYDFGPVPDEPLLKRLGVLTPIYKAMQLLAWAALLDADAGRHAAAFATLTTMDAAADAASREVGLSAGQSSAGHDVRAAQLARELSWSLKVGDGADEVSRAAVERQIARFMDRAVLIDRHVRGIRGERVMMLDVIARLRDSADADRSTHPVVKRMLATYAATNGLLVLEYNALALAAVNAPDAATRSAALEAIDVMDYRLEDRPPGREVASMLRPSYARARTTMRRVDRERQVAATMLAIRLYRLDHAGALPSTLDALVPAYLSHVPVDPEYADVPLSYDAGRRLMWSMGDNFRDDDGFAGEPGASTRAIQDTSDIVYPIDPAARLPLHR